MHHHKFRDGSSTSQIEILGDHPQEEEDHHRAPRDHPQEEVEVEAAEAVEVGAEAVEEHSHCQDTRLPSLLKSF